MARDFDGLVRLVRDWSNRDIEALPDRIIADSLRYAADKAYRTLRIAPLENTVVYNEEMLRAATSNSNNRFSSVTELQIPLDLIEFIQIREIDANFRTTRIFNEKADLRTFNDIYAEKYNDFAFWTRQGNCVLLAPGFGNVGQNFGSTGVGISAGIELHYYRRLPALYARYEVNAANANLGLLTEITDANPLPMISTAEAAAGGTDAIPSDTLYRAMVRATTDDPSGRVPVYYDTMAEAVTAAGEGGPEPVPVRFYGRMTPNWLRDENERVILMGALGEIFSYLQEDDQAQKYFSLFQQEIAELNDEDVRRNASGGNVQVNFNGRGLI